MPRYIARFTGINYYSTIVTAKDEEKAYEIARELTIDDFDVDPGEPSEIEIEDLD